MNNNFNPTMLRLAREQSGMSQSALQKQLGIRQAHLSKLETGGVFPTDEIIHQLTSFFNYPASFFFQPTASFVSGMIFHRKRSSLGAAIRNRIEAEVRLRVFDIVQLYNRMGMKSESFSRNGRSPEEMAIDLRKRWDLGSEPIMDVVSVLEAHNIVIIAFDFQTEKLDGFVVPISDEFACIAINTNDIFSPDRQRMSVAHELGHFLLHRNEFPNEHTEEEANAFAAEFLMPSSTISAELVEPLTLSRLGELKKKWRVSMSSLAFRAHRLKTIGDKAYTNLMIYLSARGYRKCEPLCGLKYEKPVLLSNLMRQFVKETPQALEELHLSPKRFRERYPEILLEGQSVMTPTIS